MVRNQRGIILSDIIYDDKNRVKVVSQLGEGVLGMLVKRMDGIVEYGDEIYDG